MPNRLLVQSRDDCKKICGYNQGRSYSDLFRVSIDPRVTPVGDDRKKNVNADYYRIDFVYKKYAPDEVRRILNNYM